MSLQETHVCQLSLITSSSFKSPTLADRYWKPMRDLIPGNLFLDFRNAEESDFWFDFDSIMIYPSYYFNKPGVKVITRKPGFENIMGDNTIWRGGHPNPALGKISAGDVLRIAMLYPPLDVQNPVNMPPRDMCKSNSSVMARDEPDEGVNGTGQGKSPSAWKPVRMTIPNLITTTISPPPPYGTDDVIKASKNNYGCPGCWSKIKSFPDIDLSTPSGAPGPKSSKAADDA